MNCKTCGAPVKYIPSHDGMNVFTCNESPVSVVNDAGRLVEGFTPHVCKEGDADAGAEIE